MDARDPQDLFRPRERVDIEAFACGLPIRAGLLDIFCRDQAGDRRDILRQVGRLAKPPGILPRQGDAHVEHFGFPGGVEASSFCAPLNVPVPYLREDQQAHGQLVLGHVATSHGTGAVCGQRAEHQAEVFDLLGRRFHPPDAASLIAERR
ncbi:hypothetical protein D3C81_1470600 [compost metagenome]